MACPKNYPVLDILPDVPLDILCEIFSCLHPTDLLALARTSKTFRSFLLKRSAAFIWRSARANVHGLPVPPSDMTEVQYAALVFGSGCHYEGCNRKARDTVWHLRVRSCASCRPKHQPVNVSKSDNCLAICAILGCRPDALEQYIPYGPFLNSKGKPIKGPHEAHIKMFYNDIRALSSSERQACLDRHKRVTELTFQFASTGVTWQLSVKNLHIIELRNRRVARAEIIRDRLVATGFKEEIDYFGWERIRKHPLINNIQALTDTTLPGVLNQLREHMLGWREFRMEEQVYTSRRQIFVDAWLQFTETTFCEASRGYPHFPLPPSANIGFSENIDSIIRQPGPISDESLLDQLYAAFVPALTYILDWHRTIRRELASLLPDYKAEHDDQAIHAQLKLATSVFQCNAKPDCRCGGRTLAYPEILFHPCFVRSGNRPSKDPWDTASQKACVTMGGSPWNCNGRVQVHPRQYVVHKAILYCGRDPRSTTAAEMDKQDPRLACLECAIHHKVPIFVSWRRAVQHTITLHPSSTLNRPWIIACRTVRAQINVLESENLWPLPSALGDTLGDYSMCLHCLPRIPSLGTRLKLKDLMIHIKNKHGVSHPVFSMDYVFDLNMIICLGPAMAGYWRTIQSC